MNKKILLIKNIFNKTCDYWFNLIDEYILLLIILGYVLVFIIGVMIGKGLI